MTLQNIIIVDYSQPAKISSAKAFSLKAIIGIRMSHRFISGNHLTAMCLPTHHLDLSGKLFYSGILWKILTWFHFIIACTLFTSSPCLQEIYMTSRGMFEYINRKLSMNHMKQSENIFWINMFFVDSMPIFKGKGTDFPRIYLVLIEI